MPSIEPRFAPQPPDPNQLKLFNRQEVDGVEVFLHRGLMLAGPRLLISLGGFWKIRWLQVDGVAALAAACSL